MFFSSVMVRLLSCAVSLLLLESYPRTATKLPETAHEPSIIGIDHIPLAVKDLDQVSAIYKGLGFAIKPGRLHQDGVRNNHVKFRDGSGIELISPPEKPTDSLTTHYLEYLRQGDGPAYISFHARDTGQLIAALNSAQITFQQGDLITLKDPDLNFLFFDQDNRSPTDKPEHFDHANTAIAMREVWLAVNARSRVKMTRLLISLGAEMSSEVVLAPEATKAVVFAIQNGRVVLLPETYQLVAGRPVIGAGFEVKSLASAERYFGPSQNIGRLVVQPAQAHGFWLAFWERSEKL